MRPTVWPCGTSRVTSRSAQKSSPARCEGRRISRSFMLVAARWPRNLLLTPVARIASSTRLQLLREIALQPAEQPPREHQHEQRDRCPDGKLSQVERISGVGEQQLVGRAAGGVKVRSVVDGP